jgi:hypothetical protein
MSPKPRRRVKQPEKKKLRQKQKQKQQQNVRVNITQTGGGASGGGGGGGSFPVFIPQPIPQQFRDTSGENVKLTGLIKNLENKIANFRFPVAQAPIPNPANDAATQTAVFNAPINYNDDLAESVLRAENILPPEPPTESNLVPDALNAPITYNDSLEEQVLRAENLLPSKPKKKKPAFIIEGEETGGETATEESSIIREIKKKRGPQKGTKYGSTKEKYRQVGLEEGIPLGRNIQNEFVMGVEQLQARAIQPNQMRLVPNEETPMLEQPVQSSSSSSELTFV